MPRPNAFAILGIATALSMGGACFADVEPNDVFADATVLGPGVLSVSGELSPPPSGPDTVLGAFSVFGGLTAFDDNGSSEGDGFASAINDVAVSNGAVIFSISGSPDFNFIGSHQQSGDYRAEVTVYDFFGDEVDNFTLNESLTPGDVDDFRFDDFSYFNGSFDVEIDNSLAGSGATGDIDFFTFTGLAPGAEFSAETLDPDLTGVDTLLGWFDDSGAVLERDDDGGAGFLSLIKGTVPASGRVTLAVTGLGDGLFLGDHFEVSAYGLDLTVSDVGVTGDFNDDGVVDAADYTVWRDNALGDFTPADYVDWANNFGATAPTAVPEPATLAVVLAAAGSLAAGRSRG